MTLDLFNCPLTQKKGYRDQLWDLLPNLQVLDGCDKDGREVGDEDEEEEEEEEDDEEDESDGEVGLEYLQKELIVSQSVGLLSNFFIPMRVFFYILFMYIMQEL